MSQVLLLATLALAAQKACLAAAAYAVPVQSPHNAWAAQHDHRQQVSTIPLVGTKPGGTSGKAVYSSLWGVDGTRFEPGVRMFDPSWAGYRGGGTPPLDGETRFINIVEEYGAVPDDGESDSEALAAAVASVTAGQHDYKQSQFTVIYFPPGEYLLTTNITISKPIVLRGSGKDFTFLTFNTSMNELYPGMWNRSSDTASPWSFRNMLIDFKGEDSLYVAEAKLADITMPTIRSSRVISVSNTEGITPGMEIRIVAKDPGDGSLIRYLFGDEQGTVDMDIDDLIGKAQEGDLEGEDPVDPIRFVASVSKVFPSSNMILLDRAIPYTLQLKWSPAVMRFAPKLQGVGVEDMTLEHKWARYGGHFKEEGHNTIGFVKVSNCWAKNLRIRNADTAIAIEYAHFCTLNNIELAVSKSRDELLDTKDGISCHHGVSLGHSADILINDFEVLTRCEHDISWDWWTTHSVAANGWGIDLNNDMHRSAPHGNLISNVGCGVCTRPWFSGGAKDRGLNSGMQNVFWNVHYGDSPVYQTTSSAVQQHPGQQLHSHLFLDRQSNGPHNTGFSPPPTDWGLHLSFIGCSFGLQFSNTGNISGTSYTVTRSNSGSNSHAGGTRTSNGHYQLVDADRHTTDQAKLAGVRVLPKGTRDIIRREVTLDMSHIGQPGQTGQDFTGTWLVEATGQGSLLQPRDLYTAFKDSKSSRPSREKVAGRALPRGVAV